MPAYTRNFALCVAATAICAGPLTLHAEARDSVPELDHVFAIVLENHNRYTSFGANGILDNPQAPQIRLLAKKYNVATNYNGIWHPATTMWR